MPENPKCVVNELDEPMRLGLRERNKLGKERAIREAARSLFVERGYAATTLRAVADRADVGFGTVFSYATDKAGLLAMVFVEELKALPPLFAPSVPKQSPMDELIAGLAHLYEFWASIPELSWDVLQQMEFYVSNPHMDLIVERRNQARRELASWLEGLRTDGRIADKVDVAQAADTLFAVYTSAVREWSVSTPGDVATGLVRLRSLMKLPMRGLRP